MNENHTALQEMLRATEQTDAGEVPTRRGLHGFPSPLTSDLTRGAHTRECERGPWVRTPWRAHWAALHRPLPRSTGRRVWGSRCGCRCWCREGTPGRPASHMPEGGGAAPPGAQLLQLGWTLHGACTPSARSPAKEAAEKCKGLEGGPSLPVYINTHFHPE